MRAYIAPLFSSGCVVPYSWWSAIKRKWIEKLPVPKKLAFCRGQRGFIADASPIQPYGVDLMFDDHFCCFLIKQECGTASKQTDNWLIRLSSWINIA